MAQPVAVLAAMEQEHHLIETIVADPTEQLFHGRRFVVGTVSGVPVVTAISGLGKVAAAATVAIVLERFRPSQVLFAGVAGGVGQDVGIGDIVIADALVQHDFDATPLFDRFVIPSLDAARIPTDPGATDDLTAATHRFLASGAMPEIAGSGFAAFDPEMTQVHRGLIGSGDKFVDSAADAANLLRDLPDLLAVEMEGAAVAQICAEVGTPFAVVRSISDRADDAAGVDFLTFVESVAAPLTAGIVAEYLSGLS